MNQREALLDLFRRNGYTLTLGQIMKTDLAAEYRARMSELRTEEGYTITLERGKTASENRYTMVPPEGQQLRFV